MRGPVVDIPMCMSCCRKLWPALNAPALDERVLVESVARKLEQCDRCRPQASRLRAAARRTASDIMWAWVEST